ncbi:MAG: aspartyl/asparaginyl beta-hydroxylase domain-containing protein [Caulobacteraceae bacterium]
MTGSDDPFQRAKALLARGQAASALAILEGEHPARFTIEAWRDLALARRMVGDLPGAIAALDRALLLEPKDFLALLSKGALLDRAGRSKEAALVYERALAVLGGATDIPPTLTAPVTRAREVVAGHSLRLLEHLRASVAPLLARHASEDLDRFEEALQIYAGAARAHVQQPLLLHYPRLPPIPFHDRALFPWLERLEAASGVIREEMRLALQSGCDHIVPYIDYPPDAPVNQWAELNHSRRWSSFFLWRDGARQARACELCPRTAELLASLPMADQPGFAPTAMFSILDARTRIPAHTGSANTRLIVHLPLTLPGPAFFRVGNVTRSWRLGEAWVFDDTIEHEAWNDADEPRAILIFDVWNPLLTVAERELVSAMMTAKNSFASRD